LPTLSFSHASCSHSSSPFSVLPCVVEREHCVRGAGMEHLFKRKKNHTNKKKAPVKQTSRFSIRYFPPPPPPCGTVRRYIMYTYVHTNTYMCIYTLYPSYPHSVTPFTIPRAQFCLSHSSFPHHCLLVSLLPLATPSARAQHCRKAYRCGILPNTSFCPAHFQQRRPPSKLQPHLTLFHFTSIVPPLPSPLPFS
jgi:hypothetical protein